jgi:hypoxanthine phosphoribosyltransferase
MTIVSLQEIRDVYARAELIYSREEVEAAYDRMAAAITKSLVDCNPLVISVMVGGSIPAGQLLPRLDFPLQVDYLHATRYHGTTRGGDLHWLVRPTHSLQDRAVLLIDDILDEGVTLAAICAACREEGASQVYTAVLLNKLHSRKSGLEANFIGLDVEDRYVFGCGMDYKEYLRNVPGIYAIPEDKK